MRRWQNRTLTVKKMGNDLYWKQTPKPKEEKLGGLHYSTWHNLKEIWGYEEIDDLDGVVLTEDDIKDLRIIRATAKLCGNAELQADMQELIDAIEKLESITFVIRD